MPTQRTLWTKNSGTERRMEKDRKMTEKKKRSLRMEARWMGRSWMARLELEKITKAKRKKKRRRRKRMPQVKQTMWPRTKKIETVMTKMTRKMMGKLTRTMMKISQINLLEWTLERRKKLSRKMKKVVRSKRSREIKVMELVVKSSN